MRFTLFSLVGLALALGVAAQDAPAWVEPSGGFGGTVRASLLSRRFRPTRWSRGVDELLLSD